jgi:S-DNA-T family DNA segregation ATPase FtsK/SpoIIIE
MASYQARQRDPLLDRNMQATLERRGRELIGMLLIALAAALAAVLWSYSPEDPGWMVATAEPAQNLLGHFGASVASTLMVIGGMGAWSVPLIILAWGVRYMLHLGSDRAAGRVVFAVITAALAAVYCATLVPGPDWPHAFGLGGLFGDTVLGAVLGLVPVGSGFGLKLLSAATGLGLVAMMLFVTGFDQGELKAIARFLMVGVVVCYQGIITVLGQGLAGSAKAAVAMKDHAAAKKASLAERAAERAERRAAEQAEAARQAALAPPPMPVSAPVPLKAGRVARAATPVELVEEIEPAPEPAAEPQPKWSLRRFMPQAAEPVVAPEPALVAAPQWGRPEALRAEPRVTEAPRAKVGLLARVQNRLRMAEAAPEPVEPMVLADDLPPEERIKARISDVIRSRANHGQMPLNPVTAAVQRREPPVARRERPQPLLADTRRVVPQVPADPAMAPAPLTATRPAPAAAPAPAPAQPARLAEPVVTRRAPMPVAPAPAPAPQVMAEVEEDEIVNAFAVPEWEDEAPVQRPAALPDRKAVVQHAPKKPVQPSTRAVAEAQPRLRFDEPAPAYELPPLSLLANPGTIQRHALSDEALEENARMLENVLDDYGVKGEIVAVRPGPVVTLYELEPAPGLKASRVIGLADDIARSMSALSARVSTVPGRSVIGIELPNAHREKVLLREILSARDFGDSNMRLPLALGKDIAGEPIVTNLAKMPHLLIAGTTGSGKSVAINTMILSLLYKLSPEECRLIMIDPKMLELSVYDGIPHLLSPVVTDPKKAVVALKWVVSEMEERYRKMSKMGVRNIEGYNGRVREALANGEMFKRTIQTGFDEDTGEPVFETDEFQPVALPYIVVIVDEMADLMMVAGKEIEACIQRLAQMARASGIHLIMATQRPSVDVITGTIKANFPTRISFQVTSKIDSRTILGEQGAEQLLGMGDMLYMAGGGRINRVHGPFVSDEEVEEIVTYLKSFGPPQYMSGVVEGPDDEVADSIDAVLGLGGGEGSDDALYDQAVAIVAKDRKCSTSYIQRKLGIGYNKAARLVEQMEDQGVVTPANHVGKREILIPEA